MVFSKTLFAGATLGTALLAGSSWAQKEKEPPAAATYAPTVGQPGKDVVWVPTAQALVDRMLDMARLRPADRLVDLGSGDGRTVITAAQRGATARGIEYNPELVALSRRNAAAAGVARRATFEHADIFQSDFRNATVVTLFLLPDLNARLKPTLLGMKPGTRVVSNSFLIEGWLPDKTDRVAEGCGSFCDAYLWIVPAKVGGTWQLNGAELELKQTQQQLEGTLRQGAASMPISDARMDGAQIQFKAGADRYQGTVNGGRITGTVNGAKAWSAQRKG